MEMILFIGIQAAGKSEFYKRNFYKTHMRINLDMLKTRHREGIFVKACFDAKQPFVIDNTNPTKADRHKYIVMAKENGFKIIAYYFKSCISECITRNENRIGKEKIPIAAMRSTHSRLELPNLDEGFDEMYYVQILDNEFVIGEYDDEV